MSFLKKILFFLLTIICLILGAWIVLDNAEPVAVVLLGFPISSVPVGIWLLAALLAGCLLGLLASWATVYRQKAHNRYLQKQLVKLRQQGSL